MLKGLGCDIIQISRMERALTRESFAERVFTRGERAAIAQKGAATAAGLWAAKEAVSKALGTGFSGFTLRDVEILCDAAGAPQVYLHRGAQARLAWLGALSVWVSITHERDAAMAVAAVE